MPRPLHAASALAALALVACGGGTTVRRTGVSAPPKPASCELEIFQKPPSRSYDVLADLTSHVTVVPREGALSVLRPRACELGADGLIVIQNMVLNEVGHTLVAATAIRYRPEPPKTEPVPASPEAPKAEPAPASPEASPPAAGTEGGGPKLVP